MKKPAFTSEQLNWLKEMLTPSCCHTSGEHNPTHFEENPEKLCYLQKYKTYDRICNELGFKDIIARPDPKCGWCIDHKVVGKTWNKETKKWE
jgi:hypothetical protein